jgi:hypothetical protein
MRTIIRLLTIAIIALAHSANGAYAAPLFSPCTQTAPGSSECDPVNSTNGLPVILQQDSALPTGATQIQGNATGTTSAVVGTLAGVSGKTTYICGFSVSALGGTASVGPITIANLVTASQVYQLASSASGTTLAVTFQPCLPANATNTAITVTTTADGTATAVDVNATGYQR